MADQGTNNPIICVVLIRLNCLDNERRIRTFGHEMMALFVEARRSDHWAMLTHHVATMTLIAGSYVCNFVPIGALVMITHDAADR